MKRRICISKPGEDSDAAYWRRRYAVVIIFLVIQIASYYLLTKYFE